MTHRLESAVAAVVALLLGALPGIGAETRPRLFGMVDLHADLPYQVVWKGGDVRRASGQLLADELSAAGVVGVVLPLYVPRDASPTGPRLEDLERSIGVMFGHLARNDPYRLPGCLDARGGVQTWFAFEGAAPLAAGDPVERWIARGVRSFGLVHSYDNELATSSTGAGAPGGLTAAGRDLVGRVHRAGAVVDVSHASDVATADVVALAKRDGVPTIATHSNAKALAKHPRNLSDDLVRAIASTGGVVGANFHSAFLVNGKRRADLADVVRHIVHLVKIAGPDHVALGSDFEGGIRPARDLEDVRGLPKLAEALLAAGLSESEVSKIFGKNALRVLCRR